MKTINILVDPHVVYPIRLLVTTFNNFNSNWNRHNRLTIVYTVVTQFPLSDNSHGWFAEEYIRAIVTRHTNDKCELLTSVNTLRIVTFVLRYAAAS